MTQLFTDTSANLPVEIIDEYGIEVIPFSYTIDGVEYIPEREFDGKAFYAAMRAGSEVKTSMVNTGTFIERFKATLDAGRDVLYIGMSGGISGTANAALMAKQELEASSDPSALRDAEQLSCKDIFDAGRQGDQLALKVLDQYYAYMGEFLANVCAVVNPECVVIGGGVSKAGSVLLDGIKPYFMKYVFHAASNVTFALASLGNDAGAYGAFKLAVDAFAK